MRILLIEDEESIQELVKLNLELEDFEVLVANDGKKGLELYKSQHFDLIVLDIMLPEMDGISVCEHIRLTDVDTPILMLTAKDSPQDRVLGLKKGADDYLVKPFNLEELILRVNKLILRSSASTKEEVLQYQFGDNMINFKTFEAKNAGGTFMLTKKEVMLLKLLIEHEDEVVSRNHILQAVWGYDVFPSTRTIDNFVLSFRKYFEKDPKNPKYFTSVRGVGYKFMNVEV